jgi:hypothetical protein
MEVCLWLDTEWFVQLTYSPWRPFVVSRDGHSFWSICSAFPALVAAGLQAVVAVSRARGLTDISCFCRTRIPW